MSAQPAAAGANSFVSLDIRCLEGYRLGGEEPGSTDSRSRDSRESHNRGPRPFTKVFEARGLRPFCDLVTAFGGRMSLACGPGSSPVSLESAIGPVGVPVCRIASLVASYDEVEMRREGEEGGVQGSGVPSVYVGSQAGAQGEKAGRGGVATEEVGVRRNVGRSQTEPGEAVERSGRSHVSATQHIPPESPEGPVYDRPSPAVSQVSPPLKHAKLSTPLTGKGHLLCGRGSMVPCTEHLTDSAGKSMCSLSPSHVSATMPIETEGFGPNAPHSPLPAMRLGMGFLPMGSLPGEGLFKSQVSPQVSSLEQEQGNDLPAEINEDARKAMSQYRKGVFGLSFRNPFQGPVDEANDDIMADDDFAFNFDHLYDVPS